MSSMRRKDVTSPIACRCPQHRLAMHVIGHAGRWDRHHALGSRAFASFRLSLSLSATSSWRARYMHHKRAVHRALASDAYNRQTRGSREHTILVLLAVCITHTCPVAHNRTSKSIRRTSLHPTPRRLRRGPPPTDSPTTSSPTRSVGCRVRALTTVQTPFFWPSLAHAGPSQGTGLLWRHRVTRRDGRRARGRGSPFERHHTRSVRSSGCKGAHLLAHSRTR
jgi:hypothetical protein